MNPKIDVEKFRATFAEFEKERFEKKEEARIHMQRLNSLHGKPEEKEAFTFFFLTFSFGSTLALKKELDAQKHQILTFQNLGKDRNLVTGLSPQMEQDPEAFAQWVEGMMNIAFLCGCKFYNYAVTRVFGMG